MRLRCRLAAGVRLVRADGRCLVVAERPLTVVEVRERGLRILERCRGESELSPSPAEERLLVRLAELGLLELGRAIEGGWPTVRVIVPVRDREDALAACLRSLDGLRYPSGRLEIVVVDDASVRPVSAPAGVRLLRLDAPRGPGPARNAGALGAQADVLAFLDSDCRADPGWLEELARELADPAVGAVGGRVLPASQRTWLERYEAVRSPLDLGSRPATVRPGGRVPYLVAANLAVRRTAFQSAGGFDGTFRFGEDVDLSWRLDAAGFRIVYQPRAVVRHAHRAGLPQLAATRAHYAASEAALLRRHRVCRPLVLSPGLAAGLLGPLGLPALVLETVAAVIRLRRRAGVAPGTALRATARGQASSLYHAARQLARYYALPAGLAAGLSGTRRRPLAAVLAAALLGPAAADWWRLRPRLSPPAFAAAHVLDELAYHVGVLLGCLRRRTLRPLALRIVIGRAGRPL